MAEASAPASPPRPAVMPSVPAAHVGRRLPSLVTAAGLAETGSEAIACHRQGGSGEAELLRRSLERMSPMALSHGVGRPRRTRRGVRGHSRPLVQLPGRSERRRLGPGSLLRYRAVDARTQPIKQNDKQGPRDGLHATGRRTVISARGAQPPASRNEMHRVGVPQAWSPAPRPADLLNVPDALPHVTQHLDHTPRQRAVNTSQPEVGVS